LRAHKKVGVIDFELLLSRLEGTEYDDGLVVAQVRFEVERIGEGLATDYLRSFSPRKLEKLMLRGLSKLAAIKRGNKEAWKYLVDPHDYVGNWEEYLDDC